MSDDFEEQLKRWLRERAGNDGSAIQALAGKVAALPPRRQRRPSALATAAAVVVALGLGAFFLVPRLSSVANPADGPQPPDPARYAGDPRLDRCAGELLDVDRVFEMTKARYFPLHFPGWWQGAPELEVDLPALVVIEHERVWATTGGVGQPGQTQDQESRLNYQMCIAVGTRESFVTHKYGPTRFDRIVPVLSANDLARAQHMDPDVFADPANYPIPQRLARCGSAFEYVFEANPASNFPRYFPAALSAPDMNVDELATIVVLRGPNRAPNTGPSGVGTPEPLGPNERDLCVILGDPTTGTIFFYGAVDITGFHVRLDVPIAPEPLPTPESSPGSPTVGPAPAWVTDLAGQLECDGPVASIGGEYPDIGGRPEPGGDSPEAGLELFLGPGNPYASLPTDVYTPLNAEPHWATFVHRVKGRPKAIVLLTDETDVGPGWTVVGLRACDASEFDPDVPLTFPVTVWTDVSGTRVSTETVRSMPGPGHCGWETATWLKVGGALYFRDPLGVMSAFTKRTFQLEATVPASATDTGYRSGNRSLWLEPGGDAYLVSPGQVERWPRSLNPQMACQ